jgi:hypothetical protein
MSTLAEVHAFLSFLREVFVEKEHCLFPPPQHVVGLSRPGTNTSAAAVGRKLSLSDVAEVVAPSG